MTADFSKLRRQRHLMPSFVKVALEKRGLVRAYSDRPAYQQNDYIGWISRAKRKEQIVSLLKGIETGDPKSVAVVNPDKYIQHNPQTHEGGEGLAALFKRLSKTNPRTNIMRIFSDGNYVFGHTEYDFSTSSITWSNRNVS